MPIENGFTIIQRPQRTLTERAKAKFLITPDNIGYFVYPMTQLIHQMQPDYILALDRGGRIPALATALLHQELYGGLPTPDHAIHLKKISRRTAPEKAYEQLTPVVEQLIEQTDSPTVVVLDDWINTGRTKKMVKRIFSELSNGKVHVLYAVMRGRGADISGDRNCIATCGWHNRGELLGIEYAEDLQPTIIATPRTIFLRDRIANGIKNFAQELQ